MTLQVISKTKAMTRLELYKSQVANVFDRMRAENSSYQYLHASLGGIYGQRILLQEKTVLDITEVKQ